MATPSTPGAFRHWRRTRPFWGGLLLVLAGLELFFSANLTLGDLQVHFGPEGFLSYLLPLLLLLCGVLTWVTPAQRLFYGILGLLTAVYSLIGLNFGGFVLGMLLGILGGAMVLAWSPAKPRPEVPAPAGDTEPTESPESPEPDDTAVLRPSGGPGLVPGFSSDGLTPEPRDERDGPPRPPPGGTHRAFVITLVPLVVTAAVLLAGGRTPARADDDCPEGLPSRPAATRSESSATPAAKKSATAANKSATAPRKSAAPQKSAAVPGRNAAPSSSAGKTPTAVDEPEEEDPEKSGPLVDGWNGVVGGIGDLLGIGAEETAAPSASASPSASPTEPSPSATSAAPASAGPSAPAAQPSGKPSASPSGSPAGSASPSPAPSSSDVPCLGPRVFKKAGPDDVPTVSLGGGTLETKSLTMYNSTYDGVVDVPTAEGTVQALRFSMDKAVNKPFKLTIPERDGATTLIESRELTTDGNVRFYTPSFRGKLFGVIPVTFTPASPPPLTLPVLWFTDVTIDLAFVRCDTLTAKPLDLSERS